MIEGEHGPEFAVVDAAAASQRFEEYVRFVKRKVTDEGVQMVSTTITEQQAKQYLKTTACRELLPNIRAVLRFPVIVERNNRLETLENGFDPPLGILCTIPSRWRIGE